MAFSYSITRDLNGVRVVLRGEVDLTAQEQFTGALTAGLNAGASLVRIDAADLAFIDSHSVAILVKAYRDGQAAGIKMMLCDVHGPVQHVLQTLGVFDVLTGAATPDVSPEKPQRRTEI
jgi:anti-anti-sigma factor